MQHTDYRTLISRGRKAGLATSDLYSAMAARRPEARERLVGETDGNGFVSEFNRRGQRVFRPAPGHMGS